MLDIISSSGSDILTDFVTKAILNNIGGESKGQHLVAAYTKKFGRSYLESVVPSVQQGNESDFNGTSRNLSSNHSN